MSPETPDHALQRTASAVMAPASAAAFPPAMQVPRRTPPSLGLGSFGVKRTLLPIVTVSVLAFGCQSERPVPLMIQHRTKSSGESEHVVARISSYVPNAIEDYYGHSRPPESFDLLTLTILSPPRFAKRVLQVGVTEAKKPVWQQRRGIVEFTIAAAELSNALKSDSSHKLFDGVLEEVRFRP